MTTPIRIIIAALASLMLLAASCDKSAKATDSAGSGDPAVKTTAASDMEMGANDAAVGTDEHADHDNGMEGMDHDMDMHADGDVTKSTSPATWHPYTLATCPVSGEALGDMGDAISYNYQGREIKFCCQACVSKFEADPAKFISKIDADIIAQQMPNYPMTTCPVSGEELGGMGSTIDRVYDNRLVRFCCEDCVAKFEADPATYFSKIDEAIIAAQTDSYPLKVCAVSGEELGEEGPAINYVVGSTLIKLCCEDCKHDVDANPTKYLNMVHEAAKGA